MSLCRSFWDQPINNMNGNHRLLIWGAGGHGKVVLDIAQAAGYENICFVDDSARPGQTLLGCPVLSPDSAALVNGPCAFVIAIGDNDVRARCFVAALNKGWQAATLVHPSAVVSRYATLGVGTVVMPRVVVNAACSIGNNCILNTGAILEHDCLIGDHVHIAPSATLGGNVTVGPLSQISLGASVLPGRSIGAGTLVGAGAVATKTIASNATAVGIPARVIQTNKVATHELY